MQGAHGRDQSDRFSGFAEYRDVAAQVLHRAHDFG